MFCLIDYETKPEGVFVTTPAGCIKKAEPVPAPDSALGWGSADWKSPWI